MPQKTYGRAEDPWPYEYLVNALRFFALDFRARDDYLPSDFRPILFHCEGGDITSGSAQEMICVIYADVIGSGRGLDWIEEESTEDLNLANALSWLYENLFLPEIDDVWKNWEATRVVARQVLDKLGWESLSGPPEFSAAKMLNEYSYGAYAAAADDDAGLTE